MLLADALKYPAAKRHVLTVLFGAVRLVAWVDGGATWTAPLALLSTGAKVEAVELDGTALDAGDVAVDYEAGTVTVAETAFGAIADPRGRVLFALLSWRFANFAQEHEGAFYEGRLEEAPRLRLAVPEFFGGIGQVGGGELRLANGDGFFDRLSGVSWRRARLLLGAEVAA